MKEWDPTGKVGPRTPLPDVVTVLNPKEVRARPAGQISLTLRETLEAKATL